MARKKLGELLIEAGVIDWMQLQAALAEQRKWGRPLGHTLISLHFVSEKDLIRILSQQLNMPTVDLDTIEFSKEALDLLEYGFCLDNSCIPFAYNDKGKFLDVAMSDPTNLELFDKIRVRTRCNIRPYLGGPLSIESALMKHYLGKPESEMENNIDYRKWIQPSINEPIFDKELYNGPTMSTNQAPPSSTIPYRTPTGERLLGQSISSLSQEVTKLGDELREAKAIIQRNEQVMRKLMVLLIDRGIFSKDELMKLLWAGSKKS